MAWPTKNTTVTDLSQLLGTYGLMITRRKKKGSCGETAGYREALKRREFFNSGVGTNKRTPFPRSPVDVKHCKSII